MVSTSTDQHRDPSLEELVDYSSKALARKLDGRSPHVSHVTITRSPADAGLHEFKAALNALKEPPLVYAAPLMPLRERDLHALTDLFTLDGIDEIAKDIYHNLLKRYPEPLWDDEPLSFLKEYL